MSGIDGISKSNRGPGVDETRETRANRTTKDLSGPPTLEVESFGELGIEGLAAALSVESAQTTAKAMHDLAREEKEQQIAALNRQVDELHDKASAVRVEGWVSGGATAAGGALTVASAFMAPSAPAKNERMETLAKAAVTVGPMIGTIGANAAKATAGAAQVDHDANATRASADAKFHEASKDDFEAIARDAKGVVDRVQQTLQNIAQERAAGRRAILRSA